jgi:signal recognition particle receptor subunit beta
MPSAYKLLFVGSMGAGKTTAIARVSDIPPISTDVANTARTEHDKATTTVALDYGQCDLPDGNKLLLYGVPGQSRFQFMWRIVARGVVGLVFLVDNSRPDPCGDLRGFLTEFAELLAHTVAVVGVGRMETHPSPPMDAYYALLQERGLTMPVFAVDVREREDVLLLLDVLFHQIEAVTPDAPAAEEAGA